MLNVQRTVIAGMVASLPIKPGKWIAKLQPIDEFLRRKAI